MTQYLRNAFGAGKSITWGQVGRLGSENFWATNGTRLTVRCHFIGPKNVSISWAQTLPLALVMDLPASKALRYGTV
jgi:hypothetical protein